MFTNSMNMYHNMNMIENEIKIGQFIESSYGRRMEQELRECELVWNFDFHLKHFGTFLYKQPPSQHGSNATEEKPMVAHIHGRHFWSKEERKEKGWPETKWHTNL